VRASILFNIVGFMGPRPHGPENAPAFLNILHDIEITSAHFTVQGEYGQLNLKLV
jgi:hypothetical protein